MSDPSTAPPILGDRYQLTRRIARGGMADIYAAWDQTLDRTVAVKVLFPHFAADPTFVARFKREARSAGSLSHPNVVAVYDWGSYEETYYIVMELIDGDSLAQVLRSEGPLSPEQAAYVTREVANALGFAHSSGMVHRDIKPGNIMLTSSGQVKVGDFGIARAYDGADDDLTQTGHVMGTAAYFSPEQAQGHPIDRRSDLYSLGVVLFEMLSGEKPFTGSSPVSVAYKHVEVEPPAVSSLRPDVPRDLERVIDILLAKRPDQRYADAADLVADLDRIRSGQPILGVAGFGAAMADHGGADATTALAAEGGRTLMAPGTGDATRALPESGDTYGGYDEYGYGDPRLPVGVDDRMGPGGRAPSGGYPAADGRGPGRGGAFVAILLVVALMGVIGAVLLANAIGGGGGEDETATAEVGTVPHVVGEPEQDAKRRVEDEGFEVRTVLEENEADPGTVTAQAPEGGEELALGETVTLTVSQADETVTMPDVLGRTVEEATNELAGLGLGSVVERRPDPEVPDGRVVSQSADPGEEVNPGTEITLVVSTGPEANRVPDVRGRTLDEAQEALVEDGFVVEIRDQRVSPDSGDIGRVIRQEPAGEQEAEPGSTVVIYVGTPDQVTTTTASPTTQTSRQTTPTTAATTTTETTEPSTTSSETTEPSTTETSLSDE